MDTLDAVVIGGGFYGTTIATYLVKMRGFKSVVILEKEPNLLSRASYHNQARVHNGYHYPRSYTTALRSRVNYPKFIRDWATAIKKDFVALYAIARRNSYVNAKQFESFCRRIGAKIQKAELGLQKLFEPRLIESVFISEESVFDTTLLVDQINKELQESCVDVRVSSRATAIKLLSESGLLVSAISAHGIEYVIKCRYVFNCTYSGLNGLSGEFHGIKTKLKHELTEMGLLKVPPVLMDYGITVMDGPFFSMMPFPHNGLHTLSHVRYTPHFSWEDEKMIDPYQMLDNFVCKSRVNRMLRDASRYVPSLHEARHLDSFFEVKTVLQKNEKDDGRPILFEKDNDLTGCYSILGGKIDNIYDVLEKLDGEPLPIGIE